MDEPVQRGRVWIVDPSKDQEVLPDDVADVEDDAGFEEDAAGFAAASDEEEDVADEDASEDEEADVLSEEEEEWLESPDEFFLPEDRLSLW